MLGIFGKSAPRKCSVPESSQKWIEQAFPSLVEFFGDEKIRNKKVLVPHHTDFPIRYDGQPATAWDTLHIVAMQMDAHPDDITLDIYADERNALSTGAPTGDKIYLGTDENTNSPATDDLIRQEDGKFHLLLEKRKLTDPERMVAYFAHQVSLIKLMDSHHQPEDLHRLADMATMMFGLGIFNANASFRFTPDGYLKQREWGYALALFAQFRGEKDPGWAKYLTPNIRSDLSKSQAYLKDQY